MSGCRRGSVPRSQLLPATSEGPDVLGLRPLLTADRGVLDPLGVLVPDLLHQLPRGPGGPIPALIRRLLAGGYH